jgi:hypothetical protein
LLDANVLSRLALTRRSDILSTAFPGRCYVAPAVYREIEAGVAVGVSYLEPIMAAEGISLCRRLGMVFVTHDRKAANFCDRAGVQCLHFRVLVEALEKRGLLTSEQARQALE